MDGLSFFDAEELFFLKDLFFPLGLRAVLGFWAETKMVFF